VPEISVMTFVFGGMMANGDLTDLGMLEALEAMGMDGVEVPADRLLEDDKRLREYKAYLANSRLTVNCIDSLCNFISEDAAVRQRGVDDLRASIELADSLKCPIVLAAGSRLSGDITPDDGRRMTADTLNACMPMAQDAGITVAIEDFGIAPTLQCAAADCAAVLDMAPGVAFVFDTGNFYFAGEDVADNFDLLAKRTCHVHFKDWIKSDTPAIADVDGCLLGEGLVPNKAILKRFLAETDVESYSLEVGVSGDTLEATKADLATVRMWMG
jgi:sugar phosphate isomerase/epimerase